MMMKFCVPTQVAETSGWSNFTLAMLCVVVLVAAVAISVPSWKRDTLTTTCDHRVAAAKVEEAMKSEEIKNELKLQVRTLEIEKTRLETEREQLSKEKITLTVKNEKLEKDLNERSASLSLVEGEKKQLESEKMKLEAENTQLKNQASQIDSQKNELVIEKREEKVKFTAKENDNKKLNEEKVALELKLTEKITLVDHLKDNKHQCEVEKKELEIKNTHLNEGTSELNVKLAVTAEKLEVTKEEVERYKRTIDAKWIERQNIGHERDGNTIEHLLSQIEEHKKTLVLASNAALAADKECKGPICKLLKGTADAFFS